ncbi:MAG: glycosyltransferase family 4 protein [Candidatus Woesearchaeota archaeon]
MLNKLLKYYNNTIFPWDFLKIQSISKKKIKIGFCSYFPPFPHGVAAATYYLMKEFAKHPEIDLYLIPLHNKFDKKLFSFMNFKFAKLDTPFLDVIVFFGLGNNYKKISEKVSCKKIAWQTMHENPITEQIPLIGPTEQEILNQVKKSDLLLTMTQWATSCYKKQVNHTAYLPHGVDTTLFTPTLNKNKFTCLFVSRLHYNKGVLPFFDAIPLVLQKDKSIYFKIISPYDSHSFYNDEIKIKIKALKERYPLNVFIDLTWMPYTNIPQVYTQAGVLVFPSNNEGFGIPLIEAMSCEVPCIVLNKKPMSEIVIHKKTGFCLPPSQNKGKYHELDFPDPTEIAKKILFLKKHPELKQSLGKEGRKRVIKNYNISNIVDQLIQHCSDLVQKSR